MRRDAFGRRRRFGVWIAEIDRRVVGYASVIAGYNTDLAAPELWMLDLFVVARRRGHGVGRALRRRVSSLGWGVRGSNTRARRFYRRLGARISDARVAGLSGRALAALAAES